MEQIRTLHSLSHDELIARIEQYMVVVELRDAEIRELHAANSALLAERDALREALEDELFWHEAQDKAISKQPNANTGHNWWRRAQHQEHAVVIRTVLAQGES